MAFDNGVDVATAVAFRSGITALVVALLVRFQRVNIHLTARHRKALPAIGVLVAVQSLCLYSSVARLPVALALLAFNTYPLWTALRARVVYGHRPEPIVLRAMPVMLIGLALALDVFGAVSGLDTSMHWARIGVGVVGNSAIMNVEPIFALVLAWALLGQTIAAVQVAGGLLVVATVMWLGLRRR